MKLHGAAGDGGIIRPRPDRDAILEGRRALLTLVLTLVRQAERSAVQLERNDTIIIGVELEQLREEGAVLLGGREIVDLDLGATQVQQPPHVSHAAIGRAKARHTRPLEYSFAFTSLGVANHMRHTALCAEPRVTVPTILVVG